MTQLEIFKNNWKPNYSDSSYECFCFRTDLNKLVEEIRADERAKVLDEVENHNLLIRQRTCGWILDKMMDKIPKSVYERELNEEDKGYLKAWKCMKEVINDVLCISIDEMIEQIMSNK